jgi:hypothetical protein
MINTRKVIVTLDIDDNIAIESGMGTIDYLESVLSTLSNSGISIDNARILDEDDECDIQAIELANKIFE